MTIALTVMVISAIIVGYCMHRDYTCSHEYKRLKPGVESCTQCGLCRKEQVKQ